MNHVFQIARNTFREAVRDKVLYVILFFAFAMVMASRAIGWVSVGQQEQIVTHFSLAVIRLFVAHIAVFVGTHIIYKEIETRTIYTILSKPVARWEFVAGKFLGLLAVLLVVVTAMGVVVGGYIRLGLGTPVSEQFALAVILTFFELMVVTALAILFSTVASPVLSAIFTFTSYLVGQVTPSLIELVKFEPTKNKVAHLTGEGLTDMVSSTHWLLAPMAEAAYWVLPNLTHFQARNRVIHGPALTPDEVAIAILYAVCYSLAVVTVAGILFHRKRF